MKTKVLFLGFADLKIDLARFADHDIWTMNDFYKWFPGLKPNAVFEIHREGTLAIAMQQGRYPGDYKAKFNESGADIVTRFSHGLDNEFIIDESKLVLLFGEKFFVGTFSYMFAMAILQGFEQGYKQITVRGIHLDRKTEYYTQIPGMLRNIDEARQRGMTVDVPGDFEFTWRTLAYQVKEEWRGIYG